MNRRTALQMLTATPFLLHAARGRADGGRTLFIRSAIEGAGNTVSLPLYRGTSRGRTVYFIVLDSSDGNDAAARGVNVSQKLANARGSRAVQKVSIVNGLIDFPASVDFSPKRMVVAGPNGFPPMTAIPGAQGEMFGAVMYSPLIELPNGVVLNAPHVRNDSGQADKALEIDWARGRVIMQETEGEANGRAVKYLSTDASIPLAAAVENVTLAPALQFSPGLGDDSTHSSRASLAAFVNGETGANNPQRQGLNSALLDGLDPLNLLRWTPNQGRYSPLWDVHPAEWTLAAIAAGRRVRVNDWSVLEGLVSDGLVTGPGATPFRAADFIVDCPIVSSD
jgi:hypothetical protein